MAEFKIIELIRKHSLNRESHKGVDVRKSSEMLLVDQEPSVKRFVDFVQALLH